MYYVQGQCRMDPTSTRKRRRTYEYKKKNKRRKGLIGVKERLRSQKEQLTLSLEQVTREKEALRAKAGSLHRQVQRLQGQCTAVATANITTTTLSHRPSFHSLPANIRLFPKNDIDNCVSRVAIGKGRFGKCFSTHLGPLHICLKVFRSELKYANYFYSEARILTQMCNENLPFLHGVCSHQRVLIMSFHSYNGNSYSLNVRDALGCKHDSASLTEKDWKNILLGCVSAITYLHSKKILHNDIKGDNIVIEKLPPTYTNCKAILIDLGKACLLSDASSYSLSQEQKQKYAKLHPQIAPEVRNGLSSQTYASDIYAFGLVFVKIVESKLCRIPVLHQLAKECTSTSYGSRPTAADLKTFLLNLFT